MARNDSFRVRWASNPAQFERPQTSLIERGWAGGANEDPPEAKWENWWHNRVDEALAEIEANGALNWQPDVPYEAGATVRDDGVNWICAIPNNDIRPSGGANDGHWLKLAAQATESEFGAVRLADAATAQGLTDALRVLTPATLAAAFRGANQQLGTSGYQRFPGGLILQWGRVQVSETSPDVFEGTAVFPVTFPNASVAGWVVDRNGPLTKISWACTDQSLGSMSVNGYRVRGSGAVSNNPGFFVIGH